MSTNAIISKVGAMPALLHRDPHAAEFDPAKSEVLAWLVKTFTPLELAMTAFWDLSKSGAIKFDPVTRRWSGRPSLSPEQKAAAKAERERIRAEKKAAQKKVRTGKVWHREGHPPGRPDKYDAELVILGCMTAFAEAHPHVVHGTSGELWTFMERPSIERDNALPEDCRNLSKRTFFRLLKKAKDGKLVEKISTQRTDEETSKPRKLSVFKPTSGEIVPSAAALAKDAARARKIKNAYAAADKKAPVLASIGDNDVL